MVYQCIWDFIDLQEYKCNLFGLDFPKCSGLFNEEIQSTAKSWKAKTGKARRRILRITVPDLQIEGILIRCIVDQKVHRMCPIAKASRHVESSAAKPNLSEAKG